LSSPLHQISKLSCKCRLDTFDFTKENSKVPDLALFFRLLQF